VSNKQRVTNRITGKILDGYSPYSCHMYGLCKNGKRKQYSIVNLMTFIIGEFYRNNGFDRSKVESVFGKDLTHLVRN
jgi:hypothetical protein